MEILIKASQLVLSLSILVVLHELGHFIPAKLFKTRVEKFYLFFDAWFSLFKFKRGDTEYGIGWLPLGGYVKIAGMIDESMDKDQMEKDPEPWEFRSKPAWQRLIIMIGGVTVNVFLACFIYALILMKWGEEKLPLEKMHYGLQCYDELAIDLGFENGDQIVQVGNVPVVYFGDIMPTLLLEEPSEVKVKRAGQTVSIPFSDEAIGRIIRNQAPLFIPRTPIIVAEIVPEMPAAKAGLEVGDRILRLGMDTVPFFDMLKPTALKYAKLDTTMLVQRGEELITMRVTPTEDGLLGFAKAGRSLTELKEFGILETETYTYGFFSSIPAGFKKAGTKLSDYVKQFRLIFNKETEGYKEVGGFGAMAKMFSPTWDWLKFWEMTAFLSLMLAFINILPIPALDGGHVMFLLYEIITRRKPNEKFMEYAQMAGMILLLCLLVLANGNDIFKAFQ